MAKPISDTQTATGIKDAYTQHWIDDLLSRHKAMHLADPKQSTKDIELELIQWTEENINEIYSGFLTLDGMFSK